MSEELPLQGSPRGARRRRGSGKRPPPPISEEDFLRAAERHLERYPTSVAGLRRVLERRAHRSRLHHDRLHHDRLHHDRLHHDRLHHDRLHHSEATEDTEAIIQATLDRMLSLNLLDDERYGRALTRRLRARGGSLSRIEARLHEKGIPPPLRDELLNEVSGPEAELAAADRYSRKRRLGHHRPDPERRREMRQRDLAALARAGFPFEIATRALEGESAS